MKQSTQTKFFPISHAYFCVFPQMVRLGFSLQITYHLKLRRDQRERDDMSLSGFEPTVELHQTKPFKGRSTD